jgi:hypothetical protein
MFFHQSIPDTEVAVGIPAHQAHVPASPLPVVVPHAMPPGSPVAQPTTPAAQVGPPVLTSDQLGKLQSELDVVQGNMAVLSEMLTELTPGKEHPSDLELLQVKYAYLAKDMSLSGVLRNIKKEHA